MTRTTIDLPADLLATLKARAAKEGATLKKLATRLLRDALAPRPRGAKFRYDPPRFDGKGVQPGVDLLDRNALWDRMDGRD